MPRTTKTTKTTEATAPVVSERAALAATATLSLPEQGDQGAIVSEMIAATTPAQFLAVADSSARYGMAADATAWDARSFAALRTGEAMYGAYRATLLLADSNTIVKSAAEVPFSSIMSTLYGAAGAGTKSEYEALPAAKRPGPAKRAWSTLAQCYALHQHCTPVRFAAYMLTLSTDDAPSLHGLLSALRSATAEAKRASDAGETPAEATASTKRTNAARLAEQAEAEAKRLSAAAVAAEAKRVADAAEAKTKRENVVTYVLRHVSEHPSSNLVTGVDLTCAAAAALSVTTLRSLSDALTIIADEAERVAAVAAAEAKTKGASIAPVAPAIDAGTAAATALLSHDTEAEADALGTEAEARPSVLLLLTPEQLAALTPEQLAALA